MVLITGGSNGIGKLLSFEFAKHHKDITLVVVIRDDSEEKLQKTFKELGFSNVHFFKAELSKQEEVEKLWKDVIAKF